MSLRVLIVDDSATMRRIVARALAAAGVEPDDVVEAADGREALRLVFTQPVDLVVTDLHMPGMDGLELVEHLRENEGTRDVPVIAVTSDRQAPTLERLRAVGVHVVRKPFTAEDFAAVVDEVRARVCGLEGAESALRDVVTEALETMAFSVADCDEAPEVDDYSDALAARVELRGALAADVTLVAPASAAARLVAAMLGSAVDDIDPADGLGELANVVAGRLARELAGSGAHVRVGAPQIVPADEVSGFSGEGIAAGVRLKIDEGWVEASLARPRESASRAELAEAAAQRENA